MTPAARLYDLVCRGIDLHLGPDGHLHYSGPKGAIFDALIEAIASEKTGLVEALRNPEKAAFEVWAWAAGEIGAAWGARIQGRTSIEAVDDKWNAEADERINGLITSGRYPEALAAIGEWRRRWLSAIDQVAGELPADGSGRGEDEDHPSLPPSLADSSDENLFSLDRQLRTPGAAGDSTFGATVGGFEMDVRELLAGDYLRQEDVPRPRLVTIERCRKDSFEEDDGPRQKLLTYFREFPDRPLVTNKTNLRILIGLFGTAESDDWTGRRVVVYRDPTIFFGGKQIGGLRVRQPHPQEIESGEAMIT